MNTPFQHFIQLAQRVLDATNQRSTSSRPFKGIDSIGPVSVKFGQFPINCGILITEFNDGSKQASIEFSCPIDYDCDGYDLLFTQWTQNVEDFLASDSMLLLDNQIKANLKK